MKILIKEISHKFESHNQLVSKTLDSMFIVSHFIIIFFFSYMELKNIRLYWYKKYSKISSSLSILPQIHYQGVTQSQTSTWSNSFTIFLSFSTHKTHNDVNQFFWSLFYIKTSKRHDICNKHMIYPTKFFLNLKNPWKSSFVKTTFR